MRQLSMRRRSRPRCRVYSTSAPRYKGGLAKAIALHGLGLYIYAGEDLPEGADQQRPVPATGLVSAEQIARINSLLAETGQTLQRLLGFLHVDTLEQIPAPEFPRVEQLLERSKRRAA